MRVTNTVDWQEHEISIVDDNDSPCRGQPSVPVTYGAIAAELLESELFGHQNGVFTGGVAARAGRFEMAQIR